MSPSRLAPVIAAPFLLLPLSLHSQRSAQTPAHSSANTPQAVRNSGLPVTRVSLYKNGVGFFEHTGRVFGDATVTIDFTTAQLNDVLQSLTAIDLNGGHISGAGYNSTTPLDQQLKSLPLNLGEDTTAADFYAAVRGARVEVHAPGVTITGRLLAVEDRTLPIKSGDEEKPGVTHHFLTVVSDAGEVRSIELTAAVSVRLLDADLHGSVSRYLQLLAGNRSQGLRHLTLQDRGSGSRELRVNYISEVPVWKSTYRLLFTDSPGDATKHTATLQGWAVVDNTVGSDWVNVQLSLIAGSPQSFIQPLSDPIYSRRPEIPIAQEAQLTPQTHDSSMDAVAQPARAAKAVPRQMYSAGIAGMAGGSAGGIMGGMVREDGAPPPPPSPVMAPSATTYEEAVANTVVTNTKTASFDDFFEYKLSEPVTIRKNESAMVPILQVKVPAENVTLVSSNGNSVQQPLRAMWITNDSGLTLDRGSFSIVENGNFGGEGLLDPVHPGEKRLLSYAADQAVHVTTEGHKNQTAGIDQITVSKGVLVLHRAELREVTYVLHNSAAQARTVVLEHPVQPNFTLTSTTKPSESTPTVYRYRIELAPGATERLRVAASHRGLVRYQLTRSDENQLAYILRESGDNQQVQAALAPVLDARRRVAEAQSAVDQTNARLKNLREEEERQRANITALNNADKGSRDRFVHDLNTTEDQIKAAQSELTSRTTALDSAKADLANRIESLQIDQKL